MPNVEQFRDFYLLTRAAGFNPKDRIVSEALKNTYVLQDMIPSGGIATQFKGGSKLVEQIHTANPGTFSFYSPGQEFSPTSVETMKQIEVPWAFAKAETVLNDETVGLNDGDPAAFKSLTKKIDLDLAVADFNGMESALWASPDADKMESVTAARVAYSIPSFVTRDGLVPGSGNGGIASGSSAWSTLATVNPTTNTWWKNKYTTYTAATPDDPDAGIFKAFDSLVNQIQFKLPSGLRKHTEDTNLNKCRIFTSNDGQTFYTARLRAANDRTASMSDPAINGPSYRGIAVEFIAELENAGWTTGSPDYFFLNLEYLKPFFRTGWFMKKVMPEPDVRQPTTHVIYSMTTYNLFCVSRQRQGRVSAA